MSRAPSTARWIVLASLLAIVLALVVFLTTRARPAQPLPVTKPEETAGVAAPAAGALAPPAARPVVPAREEAAVEREASPTPAARQRVEPADLVVRVVDIGGAPVQGVPVLLTPTVRRDGYAPGGTSRGVSDADGRIVFRAERARLSGLFESAAAASVSCDPWWLQHDVAFEEPPALELTEALLAREVVESVQPPFGALEVHVFELDGKRAQRIERVELELVRRDELEDPSLARERHRSRRQLDDAGRALFAHVEPGRECVARAHRAGSEFASEARGAGPPRPGASARIDVHMGSDRPFLTFRALDEGGRALADTELVARLLEHLFNGQDQHVRTDAEGRFRLELDLQLVELLRPELELATTSDDGTRRVGIWKNWGELEDGENDCGDVVLEPEGLLVGGRVLDANGHPVQGALVRCGDQPDYEEDSYRWQIQPSAPQTSTDADGHFAFQGRARDERKHVWAFHPQYTAPGSDAKAFVMSPAVEFEAGDAGVVLRVLAACKPNLRVLLPTPALDDRSSDPLHNALSFALEHAGSPEEVVQVDRQERAGDNTLRVRFQATMPGRFDLTCNLHGEPLRTLEGIALDVDGDLGALDLRDAYFRHVLRLHAPGGADDAHGSWRMRPTGSDTDWRLDGFHGALVSVATTAAAVDVEVMPEGFAAELVLGLSGLREVDLRPALRVRLVLVTDGPLPALPYVFDPDPSLDGQSVGRAEGSRYFTESKRESVFLLPRAGPVTIRWHLEKQLESAAIGGNVLSEHDVQIEVEDVPGEQRFELHLSGEALRELVEGPPF